MKFCFSSVVLKKGGFEPLYGKKKEEEDFWLIMFLFVCS